MSSIFFSNAKWGFLTHIITAAQVSMSASFISSTICNSSVNIPVTVSPLCLYQTTVNKTLPHTENTEFCRWCWRGDTHESKMAPRNISLSMNHVPLRVFLRNKELRLKIDLQRPALWHTANGKEMCSSLTKRLLQLIKTAPERELGHFYTQFYLNVNCWNNTDSTWETKMKYCCLKWSISKMITKVPESLLLPK